MKITPEQLNLAERLVEISSQQPIGYILANKTNKVALSLSKIQELNLPVQSYMQFADIPSTEVVTYDNHFARTSTALLHLPEYSDTSFDRLDGDRVVIYGYVFDRYSLIELDNETALHNALIDSEVDF